MAKAGKLYKKELLGQASYLPMFFLYISSLLLFYFRNTKSFYSKGPFIRINFLDHNMGYSNNQFCHSHSNFQE